MPLSIERFKKPAIVIILIVVLSVLTYDTYIRKYSLEWSDVATEIVKSDRMVVTTAARLYAYQATVYREALKETGSHRQASYATKEILINLKPQFRDLVEERYGQIEMFPEEPSSKTSEIIEKYSKRIAEDNFNKQGEYPETVCTHGCWKPRPTAYTPGAGRFMRWQITQDYLEKIQAPIFKGDPGYDDELNAVRKAIEERDSKWIETIEYWAGNLGSETPCGIWLSKLKEAAERNFVFLDKTLAKQHMVLAQALADSLFETWKIKYHYKTERPSMSDPSLFIAFPDPPFPAYVSGHSASGGAAVTVLTHYYPKDKELFEAMLNEASQSRIYAGIHFPQDLSQGIVLGRAIGEEVLQKIEVE